MNGSDSLGAETWERRCYSTIAVLVRTGSLPRFEGERPEINGFLNRLIINQRSRDWDRLFGFVLDELRYGRINAGKFNELIRARPPSAMARPSVAQHPELGRRIMALEKTSAWFEGSSEQAMEFVLRFFLSQTTSEWSTALDTIVKKATDGGPVNLTEMNKLLKVWDYTRLFDRNINRV